MHARVPMLAAILLSSPGCGSNPEAQRCQEACRALIGCGVLYEQSSCERSCMRQPVYLSCIQTTGNDCNQLALCSFRQSFADKCGGGNGPEGTGTCSDARSCERGCIAGNQPASCTCDCVRTMDPSLAIKLLINNQCTAARCSVCSVPQGGGDSACVACISTECAAESQQCVSN